MTTIKEEKLANGLNVLFADESNRYFGDYHRICILVTLLYPLAELPVDTEDDRAFRDRANRLIDIIEVLDASHQKA